MWGGFNGRYHNLVSGQWSGYRRRWSVWVQEERSRGGCDGWVGGAAGPCRQAGHGCAWGDTCKSCSRGLFFSRLQCGLPRWAWCPGPSSHAFPSLAWP